MDAPTRWRFITNHALVLLQVWQNPDRTVREIATHVQITERAVHRILTDLARSGYVASRRNGRRAHYSVAIDRPLRHPLTEHLVVQQLLSVLDRGH